MNLDPRLISLIKLLEDPDPEIYSTVIREIAKYGKEVLPKLEIINFHTTDLVLKEQLGGLIQQLRFEAITQEFKEWVNHPDPSLLDGIYLLSKWLDHQVKWEEFHELFNDIKLNVWMALNQGMSSFEKIYTINSVFYHHYHFKIFETGGLLSYNPYHLFTESTGNKCSIGMLYVAICEALEIPIVALQIPELLILGYLHEKTFNTDSSESPFHVLHYIDPESGWINSKEEVEFYLKKFLRTEEMPQILPMSNKELMRFTLQEILGDNLLATDPSFYAIKSELKHWISMLS